jgi:hypothetical protein
MLCVEKGMIAAVGSDIENGRMHRYQRPMSKELMQFIESTPHLMGLYLVVGVVDLKYCGNALKRDLGSGHC